MKPHPVSHLRRCLIRGTILLLPMLITVWLLSILFDLINTQVTPWVQQVLIWAGFQGVDRWFARLGIPIVSLLLTLLLIYLVGLLAGNLAGRRLLVAAESWILRIPLIRSIYGSARQLLDAFSVDGREHFSRVVVIQYPRRGVWTVGFVTRESQHSMSGPDGDVPTIPIFLPTTPNPTSGWMVLVPHSEVVTLQMTIEEGLKLVVSGGIVSPDDLGRLRGPAGAPAPPGP